MGSGLSRGSAGAETANKWAVLALAGTAAFMTTLDASIVNISLPAIAHTFGVALTGTIEWVIIGYLVVSGACLLSLGRLADMIGRRPILIAGLIVFTLGSALCGAAPTLTALVGARLFQGLGASMIFAVNLAMISHAFPPGERGRALGLNAVIVSLGVSVGPSLGGLITQALSWRWIFYVNVPVGAVALLAAVRILQERRRRDPGRFDPLGASLLAVGLAGITLGLSFGQEWGWGSPRLIAALAVGAVALVAGLLVEAAVPAPILDLGLLRNRVFSSAIVSFLVSQLALFAVGFLLPFYLEQLRGFSAERAGLLLTPFSIALGATSPFSGMLADRFGSRWLSPFGLAVATAGLLSLAQLGPHSSNLALIWRLALAGFGQAIFQSPNTRALMGTAPRSQQGAASGLLATGRTVGQSLSVALAGAVFAIMGGAAAGAALASPSGHLAPARIAALQQTFVTGFRDALLVCAACAAVGVLTSLLRGEGERRAVDAEAQAAAALEVSGHP